MLSYVYLVQLFPLSFVQATKISPLLRLCHLNRLVQRLIPHLADFV